jgi:hypothetical protein
VAGAQVNYSGPFGSLTVDTPNAGNSFIAVLGAPAFVPVTVNLGGSNNSVSVKVSASGGYLLQLNSSSTLANDRLNAVSVSGGATVHRLTPTELEFLYPLVAPFDTSFIRWDFGFPTVTTTPSAT